MKKYATKNYVVGFIVGMVVFVISVFLKHPIWGILAGVSAMVSLGMPRGNKREGVKSVLLAVAALIIAEMMVSAEPICSAVSDSLILESLVLFGIAMAICAVFALIEKKIHYQNSDKR